MTSVVYVGLDVHKDSITVAVARQGREAAEAWKTVPYDGVRLRKALKRLVRNGEELRVCYEAGPTGFGLCRRLQEAGIDCLVVAPSLVPGKAGDRVKTDRRDARKLAHFLRSGDLTAVYVPDEAVEAIRNQGVAAGVQRIAWEAQKRLNKRLYHLIHSGKSVQKAVIVVARELAGFIWAVGQEEKLLEAA
jgi:transposase